jgi:hypothetical protein
MTREIEAGKHSAAELMDPSANMKPEPILAGSTTKGWIATATPSHLEFGHSKVRTSRSN